MYHIEGMQKINEGEHMLLDEIKKREARQRRERREGYAEPEFFAESSGNGFYEILNDEFTDTVIAPPLHLSSLLAMICGLIAILLGWVHSYTMCIITLALSWVLARALLFAMWVLWPEDKK